MSILHDTDVYLLVAAYPGKVPLFPLRWLESTRLVIQTVVLLFRMSFARLSTLPAVLAISLLCTGVEGAQLALSNGDRLTGEVLRIEDGAIYLLSPILGEVKITDAKASIIYGESEIPVVPTSTQGPKEKAPAVAATPPVGPAPAAQPPKPAATTAEKPPAKAAPTAATPPKPAAPTPELDPTSGRPVGAAEQKQLEEVWWHPENLFGWMAPYYPFRSWKNSIDVGFTLEDNVTDKSTILLVGETRKKFSNYDLTLYAQYRRSELQPQDKPRYISEDKFQSYFRYRHDISKRYYVQSQTDFRFDRVAGIEQEYRENLGLGYRWLDSARWKATVTPSLGFQYREYEKLPSDDEFIATLFQDIEYKISSRLKVNESLSYQIDIADPEDFSVDFKATLENRLAAYLNMKLTYEWHYDQTIGGLSEKNQQILNLTFGADF